MTTTNDTASAALPDGDGTSGTDRSNVTQAGVIDSIATVSSQVGTHVSTQVQHLGGPGQTSGSDAAGTRQLMANNQAAINDAFAAVKSSISAALDNQYQQTLDQCADAKSSCMAAIQASVQRALDQAQAVKNKLMTAVINRMTALSETVAQGVGAAVEVSQQTNELPVQPGVQVTGEVDGGVVNQPPVVQPPVTSPNACEPYPVQQGGDGVPQSNDGDSGLATNCIPNRFPLYGDVQWGPGDLVKSGNWTPMVTQDAINTNGFSNLTQYSYTDAQLDGFGMRTPPPLCPGLASGRPYVGQWYLVNPDVPETVAFGMWNGSCNAPPWQWQRMKPAEDAQPWGGVVNPPTPPTPPECPPCNPTAPGSNEINVDADVCSFDCTIAGVTAFCQCVTGLGGATSIEESLGIQGDGWPQSFHDALATEGPTTIIGKAFTSVIDYVAQLIDSTVGDMAKNTGCVSPNITPILMSQAVYGLFDKWFGVVPDVVKAKIQYAINCNCQYIIPNSGDLNALYRAEVITEEQWKAGLNIQGFCDPWQKEVMDLGNTRVGPAQTDMARRREVIDHDTYCTLLRKLGVKDEIQRTIIEDANCQRPGMSDIVQMMVRDVTDEDVVNEYQLDDEFDQKYTAKLKKFAKDQGVDDDLAKLYWRQHWQMPSDSQLFDMLHRLRPGREPRNDGFDDIELTFGDIKSALQINDVMPYWVDKLMAISDRQLERRVLVKMYCNNLLTDDEMKSRLQDYGYNVRDAELQQKFYKQDNAGKGCSGSIGLTKNQILKYYQKGDIPRDDALSLLGELSIEDDDANRLLDAQDYVARTEQRDKERVALQKRYMLGDLTKDETLMELSIIGIDESRANQFADHWQRMLRYKRKEGSASLLCTWYGRGLLSIADFNRRLSNMGWSQDDVLRIIQTCLLGIAGKAKAAADKHAKEVQAALDKAAKQREAARQRAAKARCSPAAKCLEEQLAALGDTTLT